MKIKDCQSSTPPPDQLTIPGTVFRATFGAEKGVYIVARYIIDTCRCYVNLSTGAEASATYGPQPTDVVILPNATLHCEG